VIKKGRSKNKKKIVFLLVFLILGGFFAAVYTGVYPTCDYYGGFIANPDARGEAKRCDCHGMKFYTVDQAAVDGITHSVCFGFGTKE